MSVGGSIVEVSINGRLFTVAADAESNRKLGGWENEQESNGNGTTRLIKTRVPWSIDGLTLDTNDDQEDQEFLQDVADGTENVSIGITFASDITYNGVGQITGEFSTSSRNATSAVTLSGPGRIAPQ
jgi:hypothetical protein